MSTPHEPALAFARELEARDAQLAGAIGEVAALQREVEQLRIRGTEIERFVVRLPEARETAAATVREAERELEAKREAARQAEAELERAERAGKQDAVAEARRTALRFRDAAAMAERKLGRAVEERAALEHEAEAVQVEQPRLEEQARGVSNRLARLPRVSREATVEPEAGLAGTLAWAGRARAGLFVVRGGLEAERERVVRQANELGALALGEPVYATSVAGVRERLARGS